MREHLRRAVGELGSVAGVAARPAGGVLGEHVALDRRQVPLQVGEAEFAGRRRPVEALGWDRSDDPAGVRSRTPSK
jgi:hypothetical protein